MARSVACLALILLLVCGSATASKYCRHVVHDFLPCIHFVAGIMPKLGQKCCHGIGELNRRAAHAPRGGPKKICQCIEMQAKTMRLKLIEPRIAALQQQCQTRLGFSISSSMDCH